MGWPRERSRDHGKIKTITLRRTSRRLVRNVNYPLTQTGISNNDFLSLGLFNPPIYQLSSRKPWLLHSDSRPCKKWGMPKWASLTENNLSQTSAFCFFSYQRNRKSSAKVKKVAIGFEKFSFLPETKPFEAEFCQKKISSTFVAQKKKCCRRRFWFWFRFSSPSPSSASSAIRWNDASSCFTTRESTSFSQVRPDTLRSNLRTNLLF